MAKQRYINTKFWDDTYIMQLDPVEKLLFLYFLSNPLTNISGVYEISLRRIAFDTGIDSEMVGKVLKRFEKGKKMVYWKGWIYIVNFIKNQSLNPSVIDGIQRELSLIPRTILDRFTQAETGCIQEGTLNLTKLNLTKLIKKIKKPYFNGQPMIKDYGKWYVLEKGGKVLFTGKEKDIEYK